MSDPNVTRVAKLLMAQALLVFALVIGSGFYDWQMARDVFIGGLAATLGSALFALWLFRGSRSFAAHVLTKQFYAAELLKLAAVVIVFGLAFKKVDDLDPVAMLIAFLLVQLAPLLLANKIAR